jgi:hypothetical protein
MSCATCKWVSASSHITYTRDQNLHSLSILSGGECFTSPVFTCKLSHKSRNIWVHLWYVLRFYHLVGIINKHWRKYLNRLLLKHISFHLRIEKVVWSPKGMYCWESCSMEFYRWLLLYAILLASSNCRCRWWCEPACSFSCTWQLQFYLLFVWVMCILHV